MEKDCICTYHPCSLGFLTQDWALVGTPGGPCSRVMEIVCLASLPEHAQAPLWGKVPWASAWHSTAEQAWGPPGKARPPGQPESSLSCQPQSCTCSPGLL
jgi:hypothetical protein